MDASEGALELLSSAGGEARASGIAVASTWSLDRIPGDTLGVVLDFLDPHSVACLSATCRGVREFAGTEKRWRQLYAREFNRPIVHGVVDAGLSMASLFGRQVLRHELKNAEPIVRRLDLGGPPPRTGLAPPPLLPPLDEPPPSGSKSSARPAPHRSRSRGESMDDPPNRASEEEGWRPSSSLREEGWRAGAMRFVHLPSANVAVGTSDQGSIAAWLLQPKSRIGTTPPSVRGDAFATAAEAKSRRDAKLNARKTRESKLVFFKIQAAAARGAPPAGPSAAADEFSMWGAGVGAEGAAEAAGAASVVGAARASTVSDAGSDSLRSEHEGESDGSSAPIFRPWLEWESSTKDRAGSFDRPGMGGSGRGRGKGRKSAGVGRASPDGGEDDGWGGRGDGSDGAGTGEGRKLKGKDLWSAGDRVKAEARAEARAARQKSKTASKSVGRGSAAAPPPLPAADATEGGERSGSLDSTGADRLHEQEQGEDSGIELRIAPSPPPAGTGDWRRGGRTTPTAAPLPPAVSPHSRRPSEGDGGRQSPKGPVRLPTLEDLEAGLLQGLGGGSFDDGAEGVDERAGLSPDTDLKPSSLVRRGKKAGRKAAEADAAAHAKQARGPTVRVQVQGGMPPPARVFADEARPEGDARPTTPPAAKPLSPSALRILHRPGGSPPLMGLPATAAPRPDAVTLSPALPAAAAQRPLHGSQLRSDVWFATQWVRHEAPVVRRWTTGAGTEEGPARTVTQGSGLALTYHGVLAFGDGSLAVLAPQPVSPRSGDRVLLPSLPSSAAGPEGPVEGCAAGVVEAAHLGPPRAVAKGAGAAARDAPVPAWGQRSLTWLERPAGEDREPISAVVVQPGEVVVMPAAAAAAGKRPSSGTAHGLATPSLILSDRTPDVICAAFGRAVGVWSFSDAAIASPLPGSGEGGVPTDGGEWPKGRSTSLDSTGAADVAVSPKKGGKGSRGKAEAGSAPSPSMDSRRLSSLGEGDASLPKAPGGDIDRSSTALRVLRVHAHVVTALAICRRAAGGAVMAASGDAGGEIAVWSVETLGKVASLQLSPRKGGREGVVCLKLHEALVVAGGSEGTVAVWLRRFSSTGDAELAPELVLRERAHSIVRVLGVPGPGVRLSAIVTGGGEGDVRLWPIPGMFPPVRPVPALPTPPAPATMCRLLKGHASRITGLHIDAVKVVSVSLDGAAKIWDLAEHALGRPLATLRLPAGSELSSVTVARSDILLGAVDGSLHHFRFGRDTVTGGEGAAPGRGGEAAGAVCGLSASHGVSGGGGGGGGGGEHHGPNAQGPAHSSQSRKGEEAAFRLAGKRGVASARRELRDLGALVSHGATTAGAFPAALLLRGGDGAGGVLSREELEEARAAQALWDSMAPGRG